MNVHQKDIPYEGAYWWSDDPMNAEIKRIHRMEEDEVFCERNEEA